MQQKIIDKYKKNKKLSNHIDKKKYNKHIPYLEIIKQEI